MNWSVMSLSFAIGLTRKKKVGFMDGSRKKKILKPQCSWMSLFPPHLRPCGNLSSNATLMNQAR